MEEGIEVSSEILPSLHCWNYDTRNLFGNGYGGTQFLSTVAEGDGNWMQDGVHKYGLEATEVWIC